MGFESCMFSLETIPSIGKKYWFQNLFMFSREMIIKIPVNSVIVFLHDRVWPLRLIIWQGQFCLINLSRHWNTLFMFTVLQSTVNCLLSCEYSYSESIHPKKPTNCLWICMIHATSHHRVRWSFKLSKTQIFMQICNASYQLKRINMSIIWWRLCN